MIDRTEKQGRVRRFFLLMVALGLSSGAVGCLGGNEPWVLPETAVVEDWFGEGTEARLDGNVVEIRGAMNPDYLRRGGRIWARGGPYFYLFNIHVQQLLTDYPDVAAIRAVTLDSSGNEVARAVLSRDGLTQPRWREALARASLAQQEGTENPRVVERLIQFGEDHTDFRYGERAN